MLLVLLSVDYLHNHNTCLWLRAALYEAWKSNQVQFEIRSIGRLPEPNQSHGLLGLHSGGVR